MISARRAARLQQVAGMRETLDCISGVDAGTVLSGIEPALRERFTAGRLLRNAAISRARNIAGSELFGPVKDERDAFLIARGSSAVEHLCITAGTHILWAEVIRIVRKSERDAVDAETGLASREIALRGRAGNSQVKPYFDRAEFPGLSDRIRREGALAWGCWLAGRDAPAARRLRIFTPETVSSMMPDSLPRDAAERENRRMIMQSELEVMVDDAEAARADREVA